MKTQGKLQFGIAFGFGVSLLLFNLFITSVSWLSFDGPMADDRIIRLGDFTLLIIFLTNLVTVIGYRNFELSLRSPLFIALIVNMTIIALGFLIVGKPIPFTLEELYMSLVAIGRGDLSQPIKTWHHATGLVKGICLVASLGAIWCWAMIVWQTWLKDIAARYFTRLNSSVT